jgi:Predicted metal-dependent membrane protease
MKEYKLDTYNTIYFWLNNIFKPILIYELIFYIINYFMFKDVDVYNQYSQFIALIINIIFIFFYYIYERLDQEYNGLVCKSYISYVKEYIDTKNNVVKEKGIRIICLSLMFGIILSLSLNILIILVIGAENGSVGYEWNWNTEFIFRNSIKVLSTVILAPLVEEFLFRGILFQQLLKKYSVNVAIVISAGIFGIFHGQLWQGIYAFFIGLIAAYVYFKRKSILLPICIHIGCNLMSLLANILIQEGIIVMNIIVFIIICIIGSISGVLMLLRLCDI